MLKVWFQSLKINKYFYLFKIITFWNLKKSISIFPSDTTIQSKWKKK